MLRAQLFLHNPGQVVAWWGFQGLGRAAHKSGPRSTGAASGRVLSRDFSLPQALAGFGPSSRGFGGRGQRSGPGLAMTQVAISDSGPVVRKPSDPGGKPICVAREAGEACAQGRRGLHPHPEACAQAKKTRGQGAGGSRATRESLRASKKDARARLQRLVREANRLSAGSPGLAREQKSLARRSGKVCRIDCTCRDQGSCQRA